MDINGPGAGNHETEDSKSYMVSTYSGAKPLGQILLLLGVVGIIYGFTITTTVEGAYSSEVYNLGKLQNQSNTLLISCTLIISGIICILGGRILDAINRPWEQDADVQKRQ